MHLHSSDFCIGGLSIREMWSCMVVENVSRDNEFQCELQIPLVVHLRLHVGMATPPARSDWF